jgi:hypothetical protein
LTIFAFLPFWGEKPAAVPVQRTALRAAPIDSAKYLKTKVVSHAAALEGAVARSFQENISEIEGGPDYLNKVAGIGCFKKYPLRQNAARRCSPAFADLGCHPLE